MTFLHLFVQFIYLFIAGMTSSAALGSPEPLPGENKADPGELRAALLLLGQMAREEAQANEDRSTGS